MHYYQHHIGDFNNATRHLTGVERMLYRELIEIYYDTEKPLVDDIGKLSRLVMARTEGEKSALLLVLEEFFSLTDNGYVNSRCETEILKYHGNKSAKSLAGKASAAAKKKRKEELLANKPTVNQQNSTAVEQVINKQSTSSQRNSTNQEPLTNNHISSCEKVSRPVRKLKFNQQQMRLAVYFEQKIREVVPSMKPPSFDGWANDIRLMMEIDNRPLDEIKKVFYFANNDGFWQSNILSTAKLRKQYDMLLAKLNNSINAGNVRVPIWAKIPKNDEELVLFAQKNGLPKPQPGESMLQYRSRLNVFIEKKLNGEKNG